ncbi:hypothetical protein [Mycobacterium paragordonae]|uniref:Uncharacterized protein n=1 Tax=Mycobacterium paragordonae TaxID=1389713 RepID=A0ABQ1CDA1_9MYCO|nr:hypothetical protein [Mycobacterium paragordonae]GFG82312.1 hypothetical protein MPRG_55880 [Mycobacterium paragordonae]
MVIAGATPVRYELMSGGAELVDLSLLAARTAVALRRVADGGCLAVEDEGALRGMAQLLGEAAEAVDFFGSSGNVGTPPSAALAPQLDATIGAVLDEPMHPADATAISHRLIQLSERLRCVAEPWRPDEAEELSRYFSGLARSALNQTGSVGEVTTAL